jgi:hypothetical protein
MPLPDALKAGIIHEIIGVTTAPDPAWPDRTRAMSLSGAVVGFPPHMFSDSYLAACPAARPHWF